MKSLEGRGPKTETCGTPGFEEEGKKRTSEMEGNVMEVKVQTKQCAEEPMGRVPKGEVVATRRHAAQGSSQPHCRAQGQPAPVDLRDVPLGGRWAAKARALVGEEQAEGNSV